MAAGGDCGGAGAGAGKGAGIGTDEEQRAPRKDREGNAVGRDVCCKGAQVWREKRKTTSGTSERICNLQPRECRLLGGCRV